MAANANRAVAIEPVQQPKSLGAARTFMSEAVADYDEHDDSSGSLNTCAYVSTILCLPSLLCSFFVIQEREHAVLLSCGHYYKVIREPGCHFAPCCGLDIRKVSVAQSTIQLAPCKMVDHNGSPLIVSAIVTYYIANVRRAALNVSSAPVFVRDQAESVLKQVVSRYPYEATDGPSLKNEPQNIGRELVELLTHKTEIAGVKVISFDLNELTYAPEIAANMLRRQQAQALVAARRTIVQGAVEIVGDTLNSLQKLNINMTDPERSRLVTSVLTVLVGERDASPVITI